MRYEVDAMKTSIFVAPLSSVLQAMQRTMAVLVIVVAVLTMPLSAKANGIDQCFSDAANQALDCGKNVAEVTLAGQAAIAKGLQFLAQYPNCVNDVINLNWITIGISGAITTLGGAGLLPTNNQNACEAGIYGTAAKPMAKGITSLGIPGSSALQPYVEGYAIDGFKSVALGIPIPSIGAPNLAAQFECGCAIPVMGAAVLEDIRKGIQAAKGVAKNCSAFAGTLYKCGKAAVMAVLTDPAGAVGSAGGWVADKVDDAYDYLTGGCQNPPVEEYFSKAFAPHVSNVAHADANTGEGMGSQHYDWWSNDLYGKCVKFFDGCNSTKSTAERQCIAMRHGIVQSDGNGWMVGRGFYQLVRSRQFEYEITRALYDQAGNLHDIAREQAKARAATIPQDLMGILSPGGTTDSIVSRQIFHVHKALGINYSSLVQGKGLPAPGQKAVFAGGSLGFLMSQRADEVGKEGNGQAPAATRPRARAQAMAKEYVDAFNPVQAAADAMEGEYAERLRKYLTASGQQCVVVSDVYTCVKPEAQAVCVKAQGVVKPNPSCELDWKKAAQLMLKDVKQCNVADTAKPGFSCDTLAAAQQCDKIIETLGQSAKNHCQLNMDQYMADSSCSKQGGKYICDSVKASNTCEAAASYIGKNANATCDISIDKAMAKVKECSPASFGVAPLAIKGYQCSTYWAHDDCKAIYAEANSKTDTSLFCKVDVVSADKAAGERSVGVLSTVANACTSQGAVVTCPRDVQLARCKKEPYLKGCQIKRTPQYENLVKLAEMIRAELIQGLDKKEIGRPNAPLVKVVQTNAGREKMPSKDIPAMTFYTGDDPLFLDSVQQVFQIGYVNEVLKSHHPQMANLQFCKGGEKTDPDGIDQITLCAPGISEAFNKMIEEKAKELNNKMQTAPPGGGKGPAAIISAKVDARINPADVSKGNTGLAAQAQSVGAPVMTGAAVQRGAAATGAPATGAASGQVGVAGGMGLPATPGMGAQTGGLTAGQFGNTGALGANLPGVGGALPAGAGGTQQAMMLQSPGQSGTGGSGNANARGSAASAVATAPIPPLAPTSPMGAVPSPSPALALPVQGNTPHQQLTQANCTASIAGRGLASSTAPADGAYTCPAGAAQTLCEGFIRSQPTLVKRCTQAAGVGR